MNNLEINNPLNIRYFRHNDWLGQIGQRKGFVRFMHYKYCYRAGFLILMKYRERGVLSLYEIISAWAPASENNVESYVCTAAKLLGVDRYWKPSTRYEYCRLLHVIAYIEQGCWHLNCSFDIFEYIDNFGLYFPP